LLRFFLFILFPVCIFTGWILFSFFSPHPVPPYSFWVSPGKGKKEILKELKDQGYIGNFYLSWIFSKYFLTTFKKGRYTFSSPMSDWEVLVRLHQGKVDLVPVTFPEGIGMEEMGEILEKAGVVKKEEFLSACEDRKILSRFSISANSAEGYLFPDTYFFPVSHSPAKVVEEMITTFFRKIPPSLPERIEKRGFTFHEGVILASIIQKETYLPEEMPLISAVFQNRLRKGIRLEADPTAIYRMPGYKGNLTRKHLQTYTPYNTYRIFGLPAGPIGNPGLWALLSVAEPATVDYLFFVSRGDGTHVFSKTYKDHLRFVEIYQKSRR